MNYTIKKIRECPSLQCDAAKWFSEKWGIPIEAYIDSMKSISSNSPVPQWYIICDKEKIIGGLGVIENDFHPRKDLTPNVCAVYVEEAYRNQGVAGELLSFVCEDMKSLGVETLYLLTNHTSFYERYGWKFFCMVQGDGEDILSRMYRKDNMMKEKKKYICCPFCGSKDILYFDTLTK
ncbi:MAG: GNAT family N-acetyltransferase, partial [Anaeroplasmataceae bacterium]|nr:GNAT family N-acetyltransferase [Anaeroplasmataceae bacterium]